MSLSQEDSAISGLTVSSLDIVGAPAYAATRLSLGPVTISPNGDIERTSKFTTIDEAALEFWAALDRAFPEFLSRKL